MLWAESCLPNSYVEFLTPNTLECDCIWTQYFTAKTLEGAQLQALPGAHRAGVPALGLQPVGFHAHPWSLAPWGSGVMGWDWVEMGGWLGAR